MRIRPRGILEGLKQTAKEYKEDGGVQAAAALAFYTVFSLPPLLVLIISVAGLATDGDAFRGHVLDQIRMLVGREGAEVTETMLARAWEPKRGVLAMVLGVLALLFGAFGVFKQIHYALDRMWEVRPKPTKGIWGAIRQQAFSFGTVAVVFFLLLVSLVLSAGLAAVASGVGELTGIPESVLHLVNALVSFGLFALMIAAIYRLLPDAKVAWRDAIAGGALTSFFLLVGKFLIGFYLARFGSVNAFGAAGSLAIVMLWVYYAAQIFLFGAEMTQVIASRAGREIVPDHKGIRWDADARPSQA